MVEAALNAAAELVLEYGAYGARLMRDGNRGPVGAPQNLYACRGDGPLARARGHHRRAVARAGRALGDPAWARDPALATAAGRRAQHDRIDAGSARGARERDADALAEELLARGIPAAPVLSAARARREPAAARARLLRDRRASGRRHARRTRRCRCASPRSARRWYTRPGADARASTPRRSCASCSGSSDDEIAQLRADGIIGDRPVGLVAGTPAVVPRARSS